jgi:hypothetical protein
VEASAAPPSRPVSKVKTETKTKTQPNLRTGIAIQGKSALFGPYSMQVGDGLNIRAKFGFTIWDMNKPNEVNMLNAENHVVFRDTAAGWLKWNRRGVPPIKVSEVEIVDKPAVAGHPCIRYIGYQMVNGEKLKVAEFTCLQKSPVDQKVVDFWCRHFLLPPKYGFPIAVRQRVGDRLEIVLETKSVRAIPSSTISVQVPKGYKETKDKADLYFADVGGGMSKSDFESFFQQPLK